MPANPLTDPTLASQLADTIDQAVGKVRDNVTNKAVTAVRAIVFGVIVAVAAIAVATLAIVAGVKLFERIARAIFQVDHATSVWIAYLMMSALFLLAGAIAMRMRHTPAAASLEG
jgi:uncharacterized BrkB/YihY/UPF0761 family membrane protein